MRFDHLLHSCFLSATFIAYVSRKLPYTMTQQMVAAGRSDCSVDIGSPSKILSESFFNDVSDITPGKGDGQHDFALCAQTGDYGLVLHSTPERRNKHDSTAVQNSLLSASQSFIQEKQLDYANALAEEAEAELRAKQRRTEVAKLNLVLASTRSPSGSVCSERSRSKVIRFAPCGSPLNLKSLIDFDIAPSSTASSPDRLPQLDMTGLIDFDPVTPQIGTTVPHGDSAIVFNANAHNALQPARRHIEQNMLPVIMQSARTHTDQQNMFPVVRHHTDQQLISVVGQTARTAEQQHMFSLIV